MNPRPPPRPPDIPWITYSQAETIALAACLLSEEDRFVNVVIGREKFCDAQGLYDGDNSQPRSHIRDYVWSVYAIVMFELGMYP